MSFWQEVLRILDWQMETPQPYGWFHLLWFALSIAAGAALCIWHKRSPNPGRVRKAVFGTALLVALLELYKIINYGFSYDDGISFNFEWYAFPWQFCSTPMYAGLLTGVFRKGRAHQALCAYLATYAMFAGLCVMFYPTSVFIGTIGINIQTMICHGSMISIAIYLLYSGYVKLEHKTIWKAVPVFAAAVGVAMVLNEIAYVTGLVENHYFNMFYISPHCDPHLPVYSVVQQHVAYPWCLIIYVVAFSLAAYLILLAAMGIGALAGKCKKK